MLGLEMPLHHQQQNPPNAQNPHSLHHPQVVGYAHHEADHHPQSQPPGKPGYAYASKSKQQLTLSDDDEAGFNADDSAGDGKRKASPWQRMKWTDTMVKLLIMAVLYIGDEGGSESNDPKKKPGGLLQKKGKWKSVSRAMMEKGFYVSPQQCEDKFNDLNKRYKRVNDILGKGTACRVVENQSLLEMMDLSPKMKEEVKKLLNSKHLFFREMCAYHNSCGHGPGGSGGAGGAHHSPEVAVEPSHIQQQQQVTQRGCFHAADSVAGDHLGKTETEASKMVKGGSGEEEYGDDEDEDSEDEDDDESDDEVGEGGSRGHSAQGHEDEHDHSERTSSLKRPRRCLLSLSTALVQQLSGEATSVMQDGNRSPWEKKQWMKAKLLHLEEQQVSYQLQAFELEKQRLKWVRFSGKKDREMERAKLENERRRLENERMVLVIRQKDLELLDLQQQQQHSSNKRSEPSSVTG
ncbi:uncharacterized protein LOC115675346 [Syzygium oleosum]|uniref:uncharacterized protein LOC115675346 n=1 Tax=Syzygium oleosum TaxID=219896 RepID=UPI0011D2C244|nr:uncharacterized protein LOC115675346 [Syzygium oleosum]